MKNNFCVIMAGGIGSRFWPLSTAEKPKQFIDILHSGKSLLQHTFSRFENICPANNIYIVINRQYRQLVLEQLPSLGNGQLLLEPRMRNTAPCIAYACNKIAAVNPDANIVVTPADHFISDEKGFADVIGIAMEKAESSKKDNHCLITIGIKPTRPDTGYGYIQFDDRNHAEGDNRVKRVKIFTEKPDSHLAEEFIDSGDFYWNSGIFVWNVKSILDAFEKHMPRTFSYFKDAEGKYNTPEEESIIEDIYSRCKNISIDYGIMEKADNVFMVPGDFGWSDLGTWNSLNEHLKKDGNQNSVSGNKVHLFDSKNCIVNLPSGKTAILQGLDGYIIVDSGNALLICKKEEEQKIKEMLAEINAKSSS